MYHKRTAIFFEGPFWRVTLDWCGRKITLRDLYPTRQAARIAANYYRSN